MRHARFGLAAALLLAAGGAAFAQGAPSAGQQQTADPAESAKVDGAYTAACTAKVSKELCGCVVQVANLHINDVAERQVFYDYMKERPRKRMGRRLAAVSEAASAGFGTIWRAACDTSGPGIRRVNEALPPELTRPWLTTG